MIRQFVVPTSSNVQIVSFSYGGGVNGAGTAIAQGGLEPYLSLFDSAGDFLSSTYFGVTCPPGAHTNTDSGECFDVLLDAGNLGPGTYMVSLSAYFNLSFAENLGTGLLADGSTGLGNLGFGEDLHYAFDVNFTSPTSTPTPVPEPSAEILVLTGLALLTQLRKFWNTLRRLHRPAIRTTTIAPAMRYEPLNYAVDIESTGVVPEPASLSSSPQDLILGSILLLQRHAALTKFSESSLPAA